jgi:hypothetical protein
LNGLICLQLGAFLQLLRDAYTLALDNVNRAALSFERYEQLTSLAVPAELFVEQVGPCKHQPCSKLHQQ